MRPPTRGESRYSLQSGKIFRKLSGYQFDIHAAKTDTQSTVSAVIASVVMGAHL